MDINTDVGRLTIIGLPDLCPFCHKSITPNPLYGYKDQGILEVLMYCPDKICRRAFIAEYKKDSTHNYFYFANKVSQGTIIDKEFTKEVLDTSPSFVTIYNQAFAAEQQNLNEICGVGYRKALEFLIKDYSIKNNEAKTDEIEKALLGKVINDYVNDDRIKSVAKRAAWLGNDETHYVRKWEGKNVDDLKMLIDLTVHWIEMETLTSKLEADMPE